MTTTSEKTIFLNALEEPTEESRQLYLRSACGTDPKLRASVEALLAAHLKSANLLDTPLIRESIKQSAMDATPSEINDIGRVIGPYRIMEQIGEGGFGLVFVARQEQPVRRDVALKIIKPGTGSKEILARFDAERQAVAMMNHPHIAQIFDAGVTDDARPYFVMELVRGVPMTDFCDQHPLTQNQKLELFVDVCSATHHAHQKGVIHRDLKPSNVLVTLHDHKPVVKVIDFGVAKAVGQNLTDQTVYTRFFSMIGTPLYMSPEQAAMSGLDIDIRSDIYSLGVMLYQLLTGTTPFDRERLNTVGYDEVRRIIREEEPPKPSTRLTETRRSNSKTFANRQASSSSKPTVTNPADATSGSTDLIPSDLDWIVMKSLEKDRQRRYESAAAMADDIRRFLRNEPIEARPPTRRYRIAKLARRNRIALITGGLITTALMIGTGVSLYQANRAITERNEKVVALRDAIEARNSANLAREEVEQFTEHLKAANSLMGTARSNEDALQFAAADEAYGTAISLVPNYYMVWVERARLRAKLHLWGPAAEDFSAALELEAPVNHNQWQGAGAIFLLTDRSKQYRSMVDRLPQDSLSWVSIRTCLLVPSDQTTAKRLVERTEAFLTDNPPARTLPRPLRNVRRDGNRSLPPEDRLPWGLQQYIAGWAQLRAGNSASAIEYLTAAQSDSSWPDREMIHPLLAMAYHHSGQQEQALGALTIADLVNEEMLNELASESVTNRPWFDVMETILLHREATKLITGKDLPSDPVIESLLEKTIDDF